MVAHKYTMFGTDRQVICNIDKTKNHRSGTGGAAIALQYYINVELQWLGTNQ